MTMAASSMTPRGSASVARWGSHVTRRGVVRMRAIALASAHRLEARRRGRLDLGEDRPPLGAADDLIQGDLRGDRSRRAEPPDPQAARDGLDAAIAKFALFLGLFHQSLVRAIG